MKLHTCCALAALVCLLGSCSKNPLRSPSLTPNLQSGMDTMAVTPIGLMPKSHVHFVGPQSKVMISGGRVQLIDKVSGKTLEDLGPIGRSLQTQGLMTTFATGNKPSLPTPSEPYQTYAQWTNGTGNPITSFTTSWTVPQDPVIPDDFSTFFIWEGLMTSNQDLMQPVLQWGPAEDGGGYYWAVNEWYLWDDASGNSYAVFSGLETVSAGTDLTANIKLVDSSGTDHSHSFNLNFTGITGQLDIVEGLSDTGVYDGISAIITLPYIPEPIQAWEALESYNSNGSHSDQDVAGASAYPVQYAVRMSGISLTSGSTALPVSWAATSGADAYFGEHTYVVSNNAAGLGEVDLYFHPDPTTIALVNGDSSVSFTPPRHGSTPVEPILITGQPGSTVPVGIGAGTPNPNPLFESSITLTITTPGVLLSNGTQTMSVTGGINQQTLIMPSSGQVTGTVVVSGGILPAPGYVSVVN